jgi:hypothetical protein
MRTRVLALAAMPLLLGLAACAGAPAQSPSPTPTEGVTSSSACAAATLTLTPDRGAPGDEVRVGGEGYVVCEDTPNAPSGAAPVSVVDLHWIQDGATVKVAEADVAEDGTLSGSFTVPDDAAAGQAELWAGDGLHVSSETAAFTVE